MVLINFSAADVQYAGTTMRCQFEGRVDRMCITIEPQQSADVICLRSQERSNNRQENEPSRGKKKNIKELCLSVVVDWVLEDRQRRSSR